MSKKVILILILLISCVMLSETSVSYAGESENDATDLFQLVLYADESLAIGQNEIDLSGIKIDVYSSEATSKEGEAGGTTYAHDEFFSVYTDAEGRVQFSRPTEKFLILVDVATLPRNTGIAISTKFYRETVTQDRLAISKVDKVEIERIETSEEFYVNAYNREGTRINVDFSLTEICSEISGNTKTVCLEARVGDITETCEYTIPVGGENESETYCVEYLENMYAYDEDEGNKEADVSEEKSPKKDIGTEKNESGMKKTWIVIVSVAVSSLLAGVIVFGWRYRKKEDRKRN